ncbi:hypothetical protein HC248_01395 [Polaromonas vacuolata]|uniref:Uncharacterized protein n=1 Tax=Polaromonas vacuolata TaxID=37448 RepID=A0A6H2H8B2_9BURK|nr:hypothetical protein [Polaromonas vacuolata]QJC56109.1 hypothetical protein HC248_01395 [Polaromonas vacuolata]
MKDVRTLALALLFAIALSTAYLLDGPNDIQAAQDIADDAAYAVALADGGKATCAALGRDPSWTVDGDLVCRLHKAAKIVLEARL